MNKSVDSEQIDSYNELEQNLIDDVKREFEILGQRCANAVTSLQELAEQNKIVKIVIEEAKEVAILEQRRRNK